MVKLDRLVARKMNFRKRVTLLVLGSMLLTIFTLLQTLIFLPTTHMTNVEFLKHVRGGDDIAMYDEYDERAARMAHVLRPLRRPRPGAQWKQNG